QELASALAHAHETEDATGNPLRIVHGNVSPANIMLIREGAVKLLDFGVWPVLDGRVAAEVKRQGKSIPLNAPYLSPEQVLGLPTHPLQPVTPPRILSDRTPTTRMMGDTTLAAILAREPRRTTLRDRFRADPKSLLVGAGGLIAGLLIAAALLTGRSKPVPQP